MMHMEKFIDLKFYSYKMPRSIDDEIKEYELKIIKLKYDMMVEEYERKTAELAECAKICKEIDRISSETRKKCHK